MRFIYYDDGAPAGFGDRVQPLVEPSDHIDLRANRAIDALALQDSTAIGDALYTALSAIQMAPRGDDGSTAPCARP